MSKTGKSLKMQNPPHPGFSVCVDCLEPHGVSVPDGAKVLGVSRSALSHLVNGNADLSWDVALRLAKAFGSTPEGWMRLQFPYDAAAVRRPPAVPMVAVGAGSRQLYSRRDREYLITCRVSVEMPCRVRV